MMSARELEITLRRIEGKLDMLLRAADVRADQQDLDGETRKAYRRGYAVGRNSARRGDPADVDGALSRRRRSRA